MPINSRQKGAAGERELAKLLESYGWESKRGQQHAGSPDSPDVVSQFPWHIEGKRTEKTAPLKWMEKATEDAEGTKPPMIFWRPNRGQWMVMCWAGDLLPQLKTTEMSKNIAPLRVTSATDNIEEQLRQAWDAGYREAMARMSGAATVVDDFIEKNLPGVSSHPPMDDEEATKQAVAEQLRANNQH